MTEPPDIRIRPARPGDGATVFEITRRSVAGLARGHYSAAQIEGWMSDRTPAFYENLIENGRMFVAECGVPIGFADSIPGEITRLFVLPEWAGHGLGSTLLAIGLEHARRDHTGPIRLQATINAEHFYRKHGFRTLGPGKFSHGLGGEPFEIVRMEL